MAMEPNDIQRRKEQRQAYRKVKKRRMLMKILAAALALLVCAGVITAVVLVSKSARASGGATEPLNQTVIHLAAVGDINITQQVVRAGAGSYDYSELFIDVM